MIQGSFCSKLNLFHMIYISCTFVFFFRWTSKIFPKREQIFRRNGQQEFQMPSVDRADQVLTLHKPVFFCFLLLSKVMIF